MDKAYLGSISLDTSVHDCVFLSMFDGCIALNMFSTVLISEQCLVMCRKIRIGKCFSFRMIYDMLLKSVNISIQSANSAWFI